MITPWYQLFIHKYQIKETVTSIDYQMTICVYEIRCWKLVKMKINLEPKVADEKMLFPTCNSTEFIVLQQLTQLRLIQSEREPEHT